MIMGHGTPPTAKALRARAPAEPQHRRRHDRPRRHVHADALPVRLRIACSSHEAAFAAGSEEEPKLLTCREVLEFATIEGARVCGIEDRTGSLTPGKQADVVVLRCDHTNTYPVIDPSRRSCCRPTRATSSSVFVAGEILKRDGKLVGADLRGARDRAAASLDYLLGHTHHPAELGAERPRPRALTTRSGRRSRPSCSLNVELDFSS